jgi:hypothetical protein
VINIADVRIGNEVFPLIEDTRSFMKSSIGIFSEHKMEFRNPYSGDIKFEPIIVGKKC